MVSPFVWRHVQTAILAAIQPSADYHRILQSPVVGCNDFIAPPTPPNRQCAFTSSIVCISLLPYCINLLYQKGLHSPPRTGISLSPHGSGPLPQRRFAPPPTEVFTSPNGIQWISAATVAAGESKDRKGNGK